MSLRRVFSTWFVAGVLALAAPAFAQKPANAPKNATAQCNDGSFSTAKTERGACSKHGGVKTWYGGSAKSSAAPAPRASAPPPTPQDPTPIPAPQSAASKPPKKSGAGAPENATAKCKDGTYSYAKTHSGACSHHGGVAEWYK